MKIRVVVEVRPTEDIDRVMRALTNFFDPERIRIQPYGSSRLIIAESQNPKSLRKLRTGLRRQRILDATRNYLKRGVRGQEMLEFYLNKQAAYMNIISFCSVEEGESPLGSIVFRIYSSNIEKVIDWIAPPTKGGKPLYEVKSPPDP